MSNNIFEGIMVPLFIPLDDEELIIEQDLVNHVKQLLDHGVDGFLAPSGTSEYFNLSFEVRQRIVEIVVRETQGRVPVVALVSECGTRNTLRYIEVARKAGADAVMATPPYFTHVNQRALKMYFSTLSKEGGLPLWLYHQPGETKLTIEPETVADLAEDHNIVGIKIAAGDDLYYYHRIIREMRDKPNFSILIGEDHANLSALALGGHGAISTLSNIIPNDFVALWKAVKSNDLLTARKLQHRIMDCFELLILVETGSYQNACKLILEKQGVFSSSRCSAPLISLLDGERAKIESQGKELKLF